MRAAEFPERLIAEARRCGAGRCSVTQKRGDPKLVSQIDGRTLFYLFPSTPSDHRAIHNALIDVRRLLGGKRALVKSDAPSRKRNRARAQPTHSCPAPTAPPIR